MRGKKGERTLVQEAADLASPGIDDGMRSARYAPVGHEMGENNRNLEKSLRKMIQRGGRGEHLRRVRYHACPPHKRALAVRYRFRHEHLDALRHRRKLRRYRVRAGSRARRRWSYLALGTRVRSH